MTPGPAVQVNGVELTPADVRERARSLRLAMLGGVSEADMAAVMAVLATRAKQGDPGSIEMLLRVVGGFEREPEPPAPVAVSIKVAGRSRRPRRAVAEVGPAESPGPPLPAWGVSRLPPAAIPAGPTDGQRIARALVEFGRPARVRELAKATGLPPDRVTAALGQTGRFVLVDDQGFDLSEGGRAEAVLEEAAG